MEQKIEMKLQWRYYNEHNKHLRYRFTECWGNRRNINILIKLLSDLKN